MFQEFLEWIKLKFNLHQKENNRPLYFHERDIWWASFGQNVGDEENGKGKNYLRPVIVLKKFNKHICMVVPTSTKIKENKYYHQLEYNNKKVSALISHARTIDTKRFRKKIARLSPQDFDDLLKNVKDKVFTKKIDSP